MEAEQEKKIRYLLEDIARKLILFSWGILKFLRDFIIHAIKTALGME